MYKKKTPRKTETKNKIDFYFFSPKMMIKMVRRMKTVRYPFQVGMYRIRINDSH